MKQVSAKDAPSPVTCLLQTTPLFIVVGLENGELWGWNLLDKTFSQMQPKPHLVAVTALELCTIGGKSYMLSGDRNGLVKVFDTTNYLVVL